MSKPSPFTVSGLQEVREAEQIAKREVEIKKKAVQDRAKIETAFAEQKAKTAQAEAALKDQLRSASVNAHVAQNEQQHQAGLKRARGRPRKSDLPSDVILPKSSAGAEFTDQGRSNKRKVFNIRNRLRDRVNLEIDLPSVDSDEAWQICLNEHMASLGESSAELNCKATFVMFVNALEQASAMGFLPGTDLSGMTKQLTTDKETNLMFNDDLVEASILYSEWFGSHVLTRLTLKTFQLAASVDGQNKAQTAAHFQQAASEKMKEMASQL